MTHFKRAISLDILDIPASRTSHLALEARQPVRLPAHALRSAAAHGIRDSVAAPPGAIPARGSSGHRTRAGGIRGRGERMADPAFPRALNQRLFADTRHVIRKVGPPHAAETTLREGEGSCRDLAVPFSSACRAVGLAARFVSGYNAIPLCRRMATCTRGRKSTWKAPAGAATIRRALSQWRPRTWP
jgi:hypothetical protein